MTTTAEHADGTAPSAVNAAPHPMSEIPLDVLFAGRAQLTETRDHLNAELSPVVSRLGQIEDEIVRRVRAKNAIRMASESGTIVVLREGPKKYDRDPEILKDLKSIVSAADFALFMPPPKPPEQVVDLRYRDRIEKYGDDAKAIIERGVKEKPGTYFIAKIEGPSSASEETRDEHSTD